MPRRAEVSVRPVAPDAVYNSPLVTQVINKVMSDGKKSTAEQIVYDALTRIGEKTGKPPVEVLEQAVKTVTPVLEVKSRRVGGANYQVPVEVPQRREALDSLAVVDAVFAAAPVGLAFMDANFHYVRVNDALARINGLPADEHFGRSLRDVLGE